MTDSRTRHLTVFAVLLSGILAYSGIEPFDRMTWALEVFPVAIALVVMVASYRRFPLTTLLYVCIFAHCLVLILGGVYTYARVPLGFEIAELFNLTRNPYDKIGHFFQGIVPALVAREVLIRGEFVNGRRMLNFLIVCVVLAISAFYELIEWWVAVLAGQGADEFLGTQGYVWDTQSDMLLALIGAIAALVLFASWHDRQLEKLKALASR
jgi:putative membrane protein